MKNLEKKLNKKYVKMANSLHTAFMLKANNTGDTVDYWLELENKFISFSQIKKEIKGDFEFYAPMWYL